MAIDIWLLLANIITISDVLYAQQCDFICSEANDNDDPGQFSSNDMIVLSDKDVQGELMLDMSIQFSTMCN